MSVHLLSIVLYIIIPRLRVAYVRDNYVQCNVGGIW